LRQWRPSPASPHHDTGEGDDRLGRALETVKARYGDSLMLNIYSLNRSTAEKAAALVPEFLGSKTPVYTTRVVEGLPSLDAAVAIELVAVGP